MHAIHQSTERHDHTCNRSHDPADEDHGADSSRSGTRGRGRHEALADTSEDECELCGAPVLDVVGCDTCGLDVLCDSCLTSHDCDDGFDWGDE